MTSPPCTAAPILKKKRKDCNGVMQVAKGKSHKTERNRPSNKRQKIGGGREGKADPMWKKEGKRDEKGTVSVIWVKVGDNM